MTFVLVDDAACEPGKFLDEVQPEARRKAVTLPSYQVETSALLAELVSTLRYVHTNGRLTFAEHELVTAALAKFDVWEKERRA